MEHKNGGLEDDFLFQLADFIGIPSLKLTANAPENRPKRSNRKVVFQPSIFRGEHVSFREGNPLMRLNLRPRIRKYSKKRLFDPKNAALEDDRDLLKLVPCQGTC